METQTALELRTYFGTALLDVQHVLQPRDITVHDQPLLICEDGLYKLRFHDGMEGAFSNGKRVQALGLMAKSEDMTLDAASKVIVDLDGLCVAMRFVAPPDRLEKKHFALDFVFLNILGCVFFCMMAAIACLHLYPYEADAIEVLMLNPATIATLREPEPPPTQKKASQELIERLTSKGDAPVAAQKRATPPAKPSKQLTTLPANIGIFGVLNKGGMKALLGDNGGLSGDVMAALQDVKTTGERVAGLGIDVRGGVAGVPDGIAIKAGDPNARRPSDYGDDKVRLGGKKQDHDIVLEGGETNVVGALPPELIRNVIHENRNVFRYCYERMLQQHQGLHGTVKVQFVIGASGQVISSALKESTMHDSDVESCVVGKMRGLQFPRPQGGGVVIVNYPFVFKSSR